MRFQINADTNAPQTTLTMRLRNIDETLDAANELAIGIIAEINGGGLPEKAGLTPRACGMVGDIEEVANRAYQLDTLLRDLNAQL